MAFFSARYRSFCEIEFFTRPYEVAFLYVIALSCSIGKQSDFCDDRSMMKLPLTVIVLTKNEEAHLPRCLENVLPHAERIIVVDSGSTDKTQEIARKYGAEVYEHIPFMNQAAQFNWALDTITITSPWILRLDADEYLLPELWEEISDVIGDEANPSTMIRTSGFEMKRRVIFIGRWIRHGGYYPTWFVRLFRNGKGRYESREMDEHLLVEGRVERLANDFVDHNLKGLREFIERHNDYSTREARARMSELLRNTKRYENTKKTEAITMGTQADAKRKLKTGLYYRLPLFFRAFLYWKYRYFLRLGFLDGIPGLIFHFLQGFWHRFLIDAKLWEASRDRRRHGSSSNRI